MLKILSAIDDRAEWDSFFHKLPSELQDVHFTSAYARVQLSHYKGHALLFVFGDRTYFVMQPFLMSSVGTDYYELASLYGYGGPVATDENLAARYQDELWNWARHTGVAAEFCCLHPLYNALQAKLLDQITMTFAAAKEIVVIDLTEFSLEHLRRRVRRGIKAAQDAGAVVRIGTARGFSVLYDMSMKRLTAGERWLYPYEYWEAHDRESIGARFYELDTARVTGILQRSLLTIGNGETAYAHFLGSDGESRHEGLDEFLYYTVACDLRDRGFKRFHLGGGLTTLSGDSLLTFKSGFSDKRLVANRYGRIFDAVAYDSLCNRKAMQEQELHGRESKAQFFPAYRRPFG
jgi:hypothetical protein